MTDEWTTVSRKKKNKMFLAKKQQIKKNYLLNDKKLEHISQKNNNEKLEHTSQKNNDKKREDFLKKNECRLLTKNDTFLTQNEVEMLKKIDYKLFCCLCCDDTAMISKIIGRNVYSCGTCFCCIGDDPFGDMCTVYVNDKTRTLYLLPRDDDEYEDGYEDGDVCVLTIQKR